MKIENSTPLRPRGPNSLKNTSSKKSEFSSALKNKNSVESTTTLNASAALQGTDNLWLLQEVSNHDEKKKNFFKRSQSLLQLLESLRLGLLTNTISSESINNLQAILNTERQQLDDPKLIEILDEIELRTKVELAKLEK